MNDENYLKLIAEVRSRIEPSEAENVFSWEMCEYDSEFLGFLETYDAAKQFIAKEKTVVDLGCYLAVQSYLFTDYAGYIGVDILKNEDGTNVKRFKPENAKHYNMSGQEFLKSEFENIRRSAFIIMSAVPSKELEKMVEETAENYFIWYPGEKAKIKVGGVFIPQKRDVL